MHCAVCWCCTPPLPLQGWRCCSSSVSLQPVWDCWVQAAPDMCCTKHGFCQKRWNRKVQGWVSYLSFLTAKNLAWQSVGVCFYSWPCCISLQHQVWPLACLCLSFSACRTGCCKDKLFDNVQSSPQVLLDSWKQLVGTRGYQHSRTVLFLLSLFTVTEINFWFVYDCVLLTDIKLKKGKKQKGFRNKWASFHLPFHAWFSFHLCPAPMYCLQAPTACGWRGRAAWTLQKKELFFLWEADQHFCFDLSQFPCKWLSA